MVAFDFVSVGDLGNAYDEPDSSGLRFGRVDYKYKIAKYETTYGQYAEFLNAVAKTDPHGLFNPGMQDDKLLNGIARSGEDGGYSYSLLDSASASKPVTYVNFLDAIRFANWINNGQGNASTEGGAYSILTAELVGARHKNRLTIYEAKGDLDLLVGDQVQLSGLTGRGFEARSTIRSVNKRQGHTYFTIANENRHGRATGTGTLTAIHPTHDPSAKYWIPTENEWYKAAYYNPKLNSGDGGYYDWATQSDSTPGNTLGDGSNQANIRTSKRFANSEFLPKPDPLIGPNLLTAVGAFTNSGSYYGTFDQDGNVTEWNESIYDQSAVFGEYNGSVNGTRSKRGASFYNPDPGTASRDDGLMPNDAGYAAGFRLASASHLSTASHPSSARSIDSTFSSTPSSAKASSRTRVSVEKNKSLAYEGVLSSANEVWPTSTPATGTIKLTLNRKHTKAIYKLKVIGLDFGKWFDGQPRTSDPGDDVAGMHFHHAPSYTVGDPCIGLINPNQDNNLKISYNSDTTIWTVKGIWTNSDRSVVSLRDSLQYIYAGELYTNIHTERVALGEIRAQFSPLPDSASFRFLAAITSSADQTSPQPGDPFSSAPHHLGDYLAETLPQSEGHCCETCDINIHNSDSGPDWLTGLDGKDVFRYDSVSDSRFKRSERDTIRRFDGSEDLIDLRELDADSTREGLQGFTWIGDNHFTQSTPGQIRYHHGVIFADMNGDSTADSAIHISGSPDLSADQFFL